MTVSFEHHIRQDGTEESTVERRERLLTSLSGFPYGETAVCGSDLALPTEFSK